MNWYVQTHGICGSSTVVKTEIKRQANIIKITIIRKSMHCSPTRKAIINLHAYDYYYSRSQLRINTAYYSITLLS
jgi:hypothetical protein